MIFLVLIIVLFVIEQQYFHLAIKYKIFDKPNERSLHSNIVIRGGGIIFVLSSLLYFVFSNFQYQVFFFGLITIALISFWDDICTISNKHRVVVHFLSIYLLLYQLDSFTHLGLYIFLLSIILVGIINAFNFMDGINGMTGGYSLVCLLSLQFINCCHIQFIDSEFIFFELLGIIVFIFFNFRIQAKCFAGDVGSVSIAFVIVFLLLKLILLTNQYIYILFLSLYGIDTVYTLLVRIRLKENIFKAHKTHLFQLLVQKIPLSHIQVSGLYIIIQMLVNSIIILIINFHLEGLWLFILITLTSIYVYCRVKIVKMPITIK